MLNDLLTIETNRMLVILEGANEHLEYSIKNNKLIPLKQIVELDANINLLIQFVEDTPQYKNLWIPYTRLKHLSRMAFEKNLYLVDYKLPEM